LYQAYYLAGLIAGRMSQTKKLGYLNGEPGVAITANSMNAHCVGARQIDPNISCYAITMGDWTDERKHQQGAQQLLDFGCDHVISVTGSYVPDLVVSSVYEERGGVYSCGFADDFRVKVGPSVTSSAVYLWSAAFEDIITAHLNGEFTSLRGFVQKGMNGYAVDAAPPSDIVPSDILPLFHEKREELINADEGEEIVFCGEQALEGLPTDVAIDAETGCISQNDVALMGYQMGYMQTLEGEFYFIDLYLKSSDGIYIALIIVISISVIISFIYLILMFKFWHTAVIRVASPIFCIVIFLGAWLQFAAAYLYLQKPTNAICMIPLWLEMVGLTMMLSAICVKNYRLWMMLRNSQKFFPVKVSNAELVFGLSLGLLGMIAILSGFQGMNLFIILIILIFDFLIFDFLIFDFFDF
jgi:hypothetical protein